SSAVRTQPSWASRLPYLNLKNQNPVTFCRAKATGWRRDLFQKRKVPVLPEHLFAGVQKLLNVSGRSPGLFIARDLRRTSQWRDRAGFSPASLFSPLLCGAPERDEKNSERFVPTMCAESKCAREKSQRLLRSRTASSNISTS